MEHILSFPLELATLYLLQRLMGYNTTKKLIPPGCSILVSFITIWLLKDKLDDDGIEILSGFLLIVSVALLIEGRNKFISIFIGIAALLFIEALIKNIFSIFIIELADIFIVSVTLAIITTGYVALGFLKRLPFLKFESFGKKQVLSFMIGMLSFALYLVPYQLADLEINSARVNKFLGILSAISGIFLIVVSINAGQKHHYREIAGITESIRKNQEKYFRLLLSKEEETKRFRHDFNNHLYSIKYLLESGKTEELKEYVEGMNIISANLKSEILTGSDIIDAVICELRESYRDVNYKLYWNGFFQGDIKLAPIDLSSIFYNLLVNAIEAVEKLPDEDDRRISVKLRQSNNMIYFSVKNPCEAKAISKGGGFVTSKKSKMLHGFGSRNVAINVEKYDGEVVYSVSENEFEAEVFFYNLI